MNGQHPLSPQIPMSGSHSWHTRPALDMVGTEQLKNLERVLVMNYETMQAPPQQPQTPPQPSPMPPSNSQFNPYLLMQVLGNPAEVRPKTQATSTSSPTTAPQPQTQMVAPIIQYPFVPFWTGCPLPFSPLAYPQMIIPQTMPAQSIGPQLLRPVNWEQVPTASYPSTPQQPPTTPQPRPIQPARIPSTPQTIASPSLPPTEPSTEYEQKVDKYRMKRAKRTWRKPDQRLSQIAQQRTRDANGKFSTEGKVQQDEQLTKQLADLKAQLSRTQIESSLLREKLLTTERELAILKSQEEEDIPKPAVVDDMYQRQVCSANHQVGSLGDPWVNAEGGTIYSPFRGGNAMIEAFTDKVDLSQKKQALKPTNSPFLQAEFERQREDWVDLFLSEKDSSDEDEDMHIV